MCFLNLCPSPGQVGLHQLKNTVFIFYFKTMKFNAKYFQIGPNLIKNMEQFLIIIEPAYPKEPKSKVDSKKGCHKSIVS